MTAGVGLEQHNGRARFHFPSASLGHFFSHGVPGSDGSGRIGWRLKGTQASAVARRSLAWTRSAEAASLRDVSFSHGTAWHGMLCFSLSGPSPRVCESAASSHAALGPFGPPSMHLLVEHAFTIEPRPCLPDPHQADVPGRGALDSPTRSPSALQLRPSATTRPRRVSSSAQRVLPCPCCIRLYRLPPSARSPGPAGLEDSPTPARLARSTQRAMPTPTSIHMHSSWARVGSLDSTRGTCVGLAWAQVESPTENPGKLSQISPGRLTCCAVQSPG